MSWSEDVWAWLVKPRAAWIEGTRGFVRNNSATLFTEDLWWSAMLSILLVQDRYPLSDDGFWTLVVYGGVFIALLVSYERPYAAVVLAAAAELGGLWHGVGPNFAIGVLIVCAAKLVKPGTKWSRGATTGDNPGVVFGIIGVVAVLPFALHWPASAVYRGTNGRNEAITFGLLAIALFAKANFNVADFFGRLATEKADTAVAAERARIARELHDVVAHQMTVVVAQAQGAEAQLASQPDKVREALRLISSTSRDALVEMRRLVDVSRPAAPVFSDVEQPQPGLTLDDFARLAENAEAAGLRDVRFSLDDRGHTEPSAGLALSIYRLIQEAITNAAKHSPGSTLAVDVVDDGDTVRITVTNGPATQAPSDIPGGGVGLIGMQERVAFFGGTLETGPTADGGWSVVATFPTLEAPTTNE